MPLLPIFCLAGWLAMALAETDEHAIRGRRRLPSKPFDIVFMMDESGSMGTVQEALKTKVPLLFSQLRAQAPGSRAGLVGYGASSHPPTPHVTLHTVLTSNQTTFQTAAQNLVADGGVEPGYLTIYNTVTGSLGMGFTKNRPFCAVIFTDAYSNNDGTVTRELVIKALNNSLTTPNEANAKGTFFGVTSGDGALSTYSPIASATGGKIFSLDDFVGNATIALNAIVTGCNMVVNQMTLLTLNPPKAFLAIGDTHTLRINTNQLSGGAVIPKPNTKVTLTALDAPNAGIQILFTGNSNTNGLKVVSYTPILTSNTTIHFQACLVVVNQNPPNVCATATATWIADFPAKSESSCLDSGSDSKKKRYSKSKTSKKKSTSGPGSKKSARCSKRSRKLLCGTRACSPTDAQR